MQSYLKDQRRYKIKIKIKLAIHLKQIFKNQDALIIQIKAVIKSKKNFIILIIYKYRIILYKIQETQKIIIFISKILENKKIRIIFSLLEH